MSIDKKQVLTMSLDDIFKAVKDPKTAAVMQQILPDREVAKYVSGLMLAKQQDISDRANAATQGLEAVAASQPPSTEALVAEAQEMAGVQPEPVATPVPQPVVVDTTAEDAALKAIGATATRDTAGKITNVVIEYQVTDENNRPIGRPTRLWAPSLIELLSKERGAHESATRAFHRLKEQKLSFEKQREQERLLTVDEMKAIATKALETKDASEAEKVVRNLISSEFAKKEEELKQKSDYQAGVAIGQQFLRNHIQDFYVCDANHKALGDYLKDHRLEFTLDNLEAAFLDLKDQGVLAEKPGKASASKPAETLNTSSTATGDTNVTAPATPTAVPNSPAAAEPTPQSVSTPVTQPVVAQAPVVNQPVNGATVTTPATANQPHVARRPVVSGIQPGTLSAQRPGTPDPALARKEFMKQIREMDPKVMQRKLKTDPQFVKQCEAYGMSTR